jgi:hypothetical protein
MQAPVLLGSGRSGEEYEEGGCLASVTPAPGPIPRGDGCVCVMAS